MTTAYCVKCHKKAKMLNCETCKDKRGRKREKGKCSICGTKMSKYVAK